MGLNIPNHKRFTFQESMELVPLPPAEDGSPRFMARRQAWLPGSDLPHVNEFVPSAMKARVYDAAFGGHVYAQSAFAVCKVLEDEMKKEQERQQEQEKDQNPGQGKKPRRTLNPALGLHTIHGYFTAKGQPDRPFFYQVTIMTRGWALATARVEARQPLEPSTSGIDDPFPDTDAQRPLGPICYTGIVSFAQPRPHTLQIDCQEASAQSRFASILQSRSPSSWHPSPPVDMNLLMSMLKRPDIVGSFPMVDMKKVNMRKYNTGRPLHEQRELILYRLVAPLPAALLPTSSVPAVDGPGANRHVIVHSYAADRNGLLMSANLLGFARNDKTATLSNTFAVHTNADATVMAYHDGPGAGEQLDHWWLQEVIFPRAAAGRVTFVNKIWSPQGVHVATQFQDGLCSGREQDGFLPGFKLANAKL